MVQQREVEQDTLSFARALKSALREDPDVVLIGEMRDLETIAAAVSAAETGHLVLATLHTRTAVQSIDRIIDVFPSHQQGQIRMQLSSSLQAVVAQRLVPSVEGRRVCAVELLLTSPAVRNLIREGKTHNLGQAMQSGIEDGMVLFDMNLARLVREGLVSREVGLANCDDPTTFGERLGL
jgi:twitching motility protein PilT